MRPLSRRAISSVMNRWSVCCLLAALSAISVQAQRLRAANAPDGGEPSVSASTRGSSRLVLAAVNGSSADPAAAAPSMTNPLPAPRPALEAFDLTAIETAISALRVTAPPAMMVRPVIVRPAPRVRWNRGRTWYTLAAVQHGAAAFDAWSTRRNIRMGAYERNPLVRPFADSRAVYPALQVLPTTMDYFALRLKNSPRPWARRLWWLPQAASTAVSLYCGTRNVQVAGAHRQP